MEGTLLQNYAWLCYVIAFAVPMFASLCEVLYIKVSHGRRFLDFQFTFIVQSVAIAGLMGCGLALILMGLNTKLDGYAFTPDDVHYMLLGGASAFALGWLLHNKSMYWLAQAEGDSERMYDKKGAKKA